MLLENNAKIAGRCFRTPRGQLKAGQLADVALFRYSPTTPLEDGRIYGHYLYGLNYAPVHSTIARGKFLMRNYQLLTLDEEKIAARANELARETWARIK